MSMAAADVMEYVYCANGWSTGANHGQEIDIAAGTNTGGNVVRYNLLTNAQGTAPLALIGPGNSGTASCVGYNVLIYGNLVEGSAGGTGIFTTGGSNQSFCNSGVFNNTVVNSGGGGFFNQCESNSSSDPAACSSASGNVVEDNLIWNSAGRINQDLGGHGYGGTITQDYNSCFSCTSNFSSETHGQIVTGNPYVNSSGGNYQLASDGGTDCTSTTVVCVGLSLSAPYNMDVNGNTRGADGTWERGAFEFNSGAPPPPKPNPPQNLTATVH
jgi:hypothetical protein